MKNTFAPINKIPQEVLSLIPDYWEDSSRDEGLIKLTHICRSWREVFTLYPSLWTRLDCISADKVRTYIERSKSSPLDIHLGWVSGVYCEELFILAAAHVGRFRSLSASGDLTPVLPALAKHFPCPAPLLDKLDINHASHRFAVLPDKLFNGDLSSLRELRLAMVVTPLPWRDLSNLTTFQLCRVPENTILLTQFLDFFESTPHLRHIQLYDSIPNFSNAPAERVLHLPSLQELSITAQPPHSLLLNHLSIPAGVSLRLQFTFSGRDPQIPPHLPESLDNLNNLSHISAVNLKFGFARSSMRLSGPSGGIYIHGNWMQGGEEHDRGTTPVLLSLERFDMSRSKWLTVTLLRTFPKAPVVAWSLYRYLCFMENLRTLTLIQCNNLSFIFTLNPDKNPQKTVPCPKLKEIILHIDHPDQLHISELLSMAKGRASRKAKLSEVTIVGTDALAPTNQMIRLRKHVSRVEYKFVDAPPAWDALPAMQT